MNTPDATKPRSISSISLWIAVTILFLLIIAAWGTVIVISRNHPVETIPLEAP